MITKISSKHCVKKVQIRSFFWSVFFLNTAVFSPNAGKYGPEKTPYLDTFHAVQYLGTNQMLRNMHEQHYHLTSTKSVICQIDANFASISTRLERLKLIYHSLTLSFSNCYMLSSFLIFTCIYHFRNWQQLFWYPIMKNRKAT